MNIRSWLGFGLAIMSLVVGGTALAIAAGLQGKVHADEQTIHADQQVIDGLQRHLSAAQSQINGGHRDLITCGDLNALINGYNEPNSQGYIGLNQYLTANGAGYTLPMPSHCYNQ